MRFYKCTLALFFVVLLSSVGMAQTQAPVAHFTISCRGLCQGTSGPITESFSYDGPDTGSAFSYAWRFPGASPDSSNNKDAGTITFTNADKYRITLKVSEGTDTSTFTDSLTVENNCVARIGKLGTVCTKSCVNFIDSSNFQADSWYWTIDTGIGSPIISANQNPPTACFNTSGIYDITMVVGSSCNNSISATVKTVIPVSVCGVVKGLTINSVQHDVCAGHANSFSASYTGGLGPVHLMWHFTDGVPEYDTTNSPVSVSYSTAGTFPVQLISIDSAGYGDTITSSIRVLNCSASSIHPGAINGTECLGTKFNLLYTSSGTFFADNDFVAYITDTIAGSAISIPVGTVYSHFSGSIPIFVSKQISAGTHVMYIKSTDPVLTSDSTFISVSKCDSVAKCFIDFSLTPDSILPHYWNLVYSASGKSPVSLTWHWGDNTTSTGSAPTHAYSAAGSYTICVSMVDDSGCTSSFCDSSFYLFRLDGTNTMINVNVRGSNTSTGIPTINIANNALSIYPNPAQNELIVSSEQLAIGTVQIANVLGEILLTKKPAGNKTTIDVSKLNPGVYFLSVKYADGNSEVRKFVKE